jgi:hypothetical protein
MTLHETLNLWKRNLKAIPAEIWEQAEVAVLFWPTTA